MSIYHLWSPWPVFGGVIAILNRDSYYPSSSVCVVVTRSGNWSTRANGDKTILTGYPGHREVARCYITGAGAISASGNERDVIQDGGRKRKWRLCLLYSISRPPYTVYEAWTSLAWCRSSSGEYHWTFWLAEFFIPGFVHNRWGELLHMIKTRSRRYFSIFAVSLRIFLRFSVRQFSCFCIFKFACFLSWWWLREKETTRWGLAIGTCSLKTAFKATQRL